VDRRPRLIDHAHTRPTKDVPRLAALVYGDRVEFDATAGKARRKRSVGSQLTCDRSRSSDHGPLWDPDPCAHRSGGPKPPESCREGGPDPKVDHSMHALSWTETKHSPKMHVEVAKLS
jgi:hypothetical protein